MKKWAKELLKEANINLNIKDIKSVELHNITVINHKLERLGETDPFPHRQAILVTTSEGKKYEILRETVDKNGNFSTDSALFITRETRKR